MSDTLPPAGSTDSDDGLQALLGAARQAERGGAWKDALALYERAFAVSRGGDAGERAEVLRRMGILHRERGDLELAQEKLEAALAVAGAAGLRDVAARVTNDLGGVQLRRGEPDAAEATYLRTAALAAEAGDARLAAVVEQNLGILAMIRGDMEAAAVRYRRALEGLRGAGDDRATAMTLNNLGLVLRDRGDLSGAEAALDEAFALGSGGDDARTVAFVELNRAELYLARHQLPRARASAERALEAADRMGSRWRIASAHKLLGTVAREEGDLATAEERFRRAVELAESAGDRLLQAEVESERALLFLAARRPNRDLFGALSRSHRLFAEVQARRDAADVARRLDRLEVTYLGVVREWAESIESVDRYTVGHCRRVADYASRLAEAIGFAGRDLVWIRMGAFLHDVGKTAVSAAVLNKAGPLEPAEWDQMRLHPVAGEKIVAELDFPWDVRPLVRSHHEHWDGSGYPDGLRGEEIPLLARVLCIADVFDALTSHRSYRGAMARDQALRTMQEEAGRTLDPDLFATFRDLIRQP